VIKNVLIPILTLSAAVALIACDAGDEESPSPTDTSPATEAVPTGTASTVASTATLEPGVTPEPFEGTRGPIDVEKPPAPPVSVLTDVRIGLHEGYDRFVLEFEERLPGYRISYIDAPVTQCASGEEVPVEGAAILEVRMYPGASYDEQGNPVFPEQRVSAGLPSIIEATKTCDFEAVLTWTLGLTEEADFRVYELTQPFRLVVDVEHR
jgi:hypothetical protein